MSLVAPSPKCQDEADWIIKQTRSRDDVRHDRRTPYCIRWRPRPDSVVRGILCSRPSGPASPFLGLTASDAAGRAAAGRQAWQAPRPMQPMDELMPEWRMSPLKQKQKQEPSPYR